MTLFCVGFVCGVFAVCVFDVVSEVLKPIDPHCGDCAKLMHRCRCEGGPV